MESAERGRDSSSNSNILTHIAGTSISLSLSLTLKREGENKVQNIDTWLFYNIISLLSLSVSE